LGKISKSDNYCYSNTPITDLDLLLRIFRALEKEYPEEYKANLEQEIQSIYQMSPDVAEHNEFQIPLRLLSTAVRYKQTKGDRRKKFTRTFT
jgi:hypothetical protein